MARFDKPPTSWTEVFSGYPGDIQKLARQVRDVVRQALPQCNETVKGAKMMGYGYYWIDSPSDVICMISPEDEHVKLYVHHIQSDATGSLKVEGTGKNARHVKLQSVDKASIQGLLAQVLEARAG